MMKNSVTRAQGKLEQAIRHPDVLEQVWSSVVQQKIVLLCDQGKGLEKAKRYERELAADPGDHRRWLLCTAAYEFAGEYEQALKLASKGMERFPETASLYIHAGDTAPL